MQNKGKHFKAVFVMIWG